MDIEKTTAQIKDDIIRAEGLKWSIQKTTKPGLLVNAERGMG